MTNRLTCPKCGSHEFDQERTMLYEEVCVVTFGLNGEIEHEVIENSDCCGEESTEAYCCKQCGWELVDEDGEPITSADEIVAAFEQARKARQAKGGTPDDIPDDPKAYYSMTGEWRGWRDFLGVPADSPICDECGNYPCDCTVDRAAAEAQK